MLEMPKTRLTKLDTMAEVRMCVRVLVDVIKHHGTRHFHFEPIT